MGKLPAIQFYTGDWIKDPQLSMCSPSSRGIWIDMLCAMHEAGRGGQITGTGEQLARLCRCTSAELIETIADLRSTGAAIVSEREGVFTVINRRMKRENEERTGGAVRQARFREKGGGDPERWTAIRAQILIRDDKVCAYCGRRATTVDHVIPKSNGGSHEPDNLVACCKKCNNKKTNRMPHEAKMHFWNGFDMSLISYRLPRSDAEVTPPLSSSVSISVTESAADAAPAVKAKDSSLEHLAVIAFRDIQRCWPAPGVPRESIIARVPVDDAHLARWRLTLQTWRMRGNKPTNVEGLLDWFEHGIPNPHKGNGQSNGAADTTPVTKATEDWQKELLEDYGKATR